MSTSITRGGIYRYTLTRGSDELAARLLYLMLNPSTADALYDDATTRRCHAYSFYNDFGGAFSIGNLYAFRTPFPQALWGAQRGGADIVGPENDRWLLELAAKAQIIVFAWGCQERALTRASAVIHLLREHVAKFHILGRTKHGHPSHPLRMRRELQFVPWYQVGHGG